jgi:asparagine synthase (glutamine-hydrolysing)
MTAIFGIIQHDHSPIQPETLQAAAHSLRHHAEHGLGTWQGSYAALGQALTRFWRSSAHAPAPERDQERGLTLAADARLDNRAELARLLGIAPADLAGIPDSRLLLHAYRAWGEACPQYLLGDFVFAVWDEAKHSLFAARDPIGIRWLYYAASPRRFAFASDPAGLLELMDEAPRIDLDYLDQYLTSDSDTPVGKTFYANVRKLQPGETILVREGSLKTTIFWQAAGVQPDPSLKDPREGIELLRGLLREAVSCRADTPDRLGAHLSGGLDSSAMTALAVSANRQAGRPDPLAFSWSPPVAMRPLMDRDERLYVQRIAEHLGLPVAYTHVPPEVDVLHETSDPSTLPLNTIRFEYKVMENARRLGARVLLSGWGGDELVFSRGIGYPSGLIKQGRLLALARYLKYQYGWKPLRWVNGIYQHGLYPLFPAAWQARLPVSLKWERDARQRLISQAQKEFQLRLPAREFFQAQFYSLLEQKHVPEFAWIKPGLRASQVWYLQALLARVESWAAWSARLGARHAYPLLDQRVVEFALRMPEDWIYYGGQLRKFGRQSVSDVLPPGLFEGRDKQDRALFAHQKTIEHKREVRRARLEIFEAHARGNPPAAQWLDFDYLQRILLEPPVTSDQPLPPELAPLPRNGIWQVLNFAFIDRRAVLPEKP